MSEVKNVAPPRALEDYRQKADFESLLANDGWATIERHMKARIEQIGEALDKPLSDHNSVFLNEYNKGRRAELKWILALPRKAVTAAVEGIKIIEDAEAAVKAAEPTVEEIDDGNESGEE